MSTIKRYRYDACDLKNNPEVIEEYKSYDTSGKV